MIQEIFTVLAPVIIIGAIGFAWVKAGQPFDNATVSSLVMTVGSPCLIYSSLTGTDIELATIGHIAAAAAFSIVGTALLGAALLALYRTLVRDREAFAWRTYVPSLSHGNSGNMGLPLVLMAFGETGLALGMAYFFVNSISQFTFGIAVASGRFNPLELLKQPVVWAVLLALATLKFDVTAPRWFDATTTLLGGLTIPAMLLMLGTSIARLNVASLRETIPVAVTRLVIGFAIGLCAIWLFNLEGVLAGVVILQSTMPAAVFNYVFAERFGGDHDKVAAVVLASTLMAALLLPFLVGFALNLN